MAKNIFIFLKLYKKKPNKQKTKRIRESSCVWPAEPKYLPQRGCTVVKPVKEAEKKWPMR